jgi:hypothetical protein
MIPDLLKFWLQVSRSVSRSGAYQRLHHRAARDRFGNLECDLDRQAEFAALAIPVLGRSGVVSARCATT